MTDEYWTDDQIRETLRATYASPPFPTDAIAAQVEETVRARNDRRLLHHPTFRSLLAVAAALVIFVAGAEYGRSRTARGADVPTATPIAIQQAGSEYVARLAKLSDASHDLAAGERDEAHQVALAILYAATLELLRDSENDQLLAAAAQLIFSRRQADRNPSHEGVIWF